MSVSFDIQSHVAPYKVIIGDGLLAGQLAEMSNGVVMCDVYFAGRFESSGSRVIAVEATERAKSLDRMPDIISQMRKCGVTRKSGVLAVGGGVIQDIATFCASIYMRGIRWRYVPSTLLGMVDSCIGGKSSINVDSYKNIVGNFYPPDAVVIDPVLAQTLSAERKAAGLCEAAKICYAGGDKVFERYLAMGPDVDMDERAIEPLIELSLRTKKWFVEIDEFDKAERQLLNFGHTFGHAIEGATEFRISHGVAVGLGMLASIRFAQASGRVATLSAKTESLVRHVRALLAVVPDIDAALRGVTADTLFDCFAADKKHSAGAFVIVTISDSGALERVELERTEANIRQIKRTFSAVVEAGRLA